MYLDTYWREISNEMTGMTQILVQMIAFNQDIIAAYPKLLIVTIYLLPKI